MSKTKTWEPVRHGVSLDNVHEVHREEILHFLDQDKLSPPPSRAVLFVGSSTIRLWTTLHSAMNGIPCIQRGFGGSKSWESLYFFDDIVAPYRPAAIVYYSGSNDLNSREATPRETLAYTSRFMDLVNQRMPGTPMLYMSITRTPSTRDIWPWMNQVNDQMLQYSGQRDGLTYFDMNPHVRGPNGEPDESCFEDDFHHLNTTGYRRIEPPLKQAIEPLYRRSQGAG